MTKGAMIDYYRAVAAAIVPHLAGRPLTLGRFPEGVDGRGFYQTNCRGNPEWLRVQEVVGRTGKLFRLCVVDDEASLVWVANQGVIELHPFLATGDSPDRPTSLVFDLDPGPPATIAECCGVALRLRDVLGASGLEAFTKTSGGLGLHVFVPLDTDASFDATKAFARAVAGRLTAERPAGVIDVQRRDARAGKVLIDWLQNDPTRSTVSVYSLRATSLPAVSTPVTWDEVEDAARSRDAGALRFGPRDVLDRLGRLGDLFAPALALRQRLPG
jgi:bifunctional non-homologous end joining protein LigD